MLALLLLVIPAGLVAGESASNREAIARKTTILLSDADWKLGSYSFDEGERLGAFRPDFDDRGFRTVQVPGEVQLQIGLQGMDLYYQSAQLTLVNEKEWWYRKRFVVPKESAGKLMRLVFDGVDYFASVWLNGEKLGEHEGCYVPFEFDVSSQLKYGEENHLTVKVTAPWVPKGRGFLEYMKGEWTLVSPGNIMRFPGPPYILGPYWDGIPAYGNAVFPMGLFRDVKLVASGLAVVDDLFVTTKSLNADGSATLGVSGKIRNYGQENVGATLELKIAPDNFSGEPLTLPKRSLDIRPGENSFSEEVTVKDPQLWWTWDSGEPSLYKATATITSAAGATPDGRETVFGIRTIVRRNDMSYWLNGKRMFLKGAWYPMADYFGSKPTRQTYEKDLEMYRAANLNHLVAFTVVEKPDFYDLCDRLGILVMFEFPFEQFGPIEVLAYTNPRRETFVKESLRQVRNIIVQLRNHPSIIVWAAFAEARMGGKGWGVGDENWEQYGYTEYSDQIGKLVAELAPGTVYHPSLCDVGEQHFWMGNAGMGSRDGYQDQFHANAGFVSEYGSIALPGYETLRKILTPEEMWSESNIPVRRWYNLPINIPVYAYQTSFEYTGLAGVLHRVHSFVDRHVKSIHELIDDSQLYQAMIFKYATESYRRKKYDSVNGTRIWAYGEVMPGIRFNFLDYYRLPKMGYYYLKNAQKRFALNFAYEEALESQPAGKELQIPVWVVNDYPRDMAVEVRCEIFNLNGEKIWSRDFAGPLGPDAARQLATVDWVTPESPGIYVLRGRASEKGGHLVAEDSTFIKVTPRLFARPLRLLLIGQEKYNPPLAMMLRGMGLQVNVIDEKSIQQLDQLQNPEELRKKYDVVWLASFDSLWKLLDAKMAEGLAQAVEQGVGFVHSGGPGSFHGGFGRAALLDVTPLERVLPVKLQNRNDVVLGQLSTPGERIAQGFSAIKAIAAGAAPDPGWDAASLNEFGVPGFNDVDPKQGGEIVLTISGRPLLVLGRYGKGRVVAFTGFTPEHQPRKAFAAPDLPSRNLLDQEFVNDPSTRAYFDLYMRLVAAAVEEKPITDYRQILAARDKPLFETLQDQAPATLQLPKSVQAAVSGGRAGASLNLANGARYARLVRVRAEWDAPEAQAPYLVMYNDNYIDLLPGENKEIGLDLRLPPGANKPVAGRLIVEGSNLAPASVPIMLTPR